MLQYVETDGSEPYAQMKQLICKSKEQATMLDVAGHQLDREYGEES
jgi:hypothetical protein